MSPYIVYRPPWIRIQQLRRTIRISGSLPRRLFLNRPGENRAGCPRSSAPQAPPLVATLGFFTASVLP